MERVEPKQVVDLVSPVEPSILKKYNDAVPGSGERIIELVRAQALHRMSAENRGQWMAFSIAIFCIASALIAALADKQIFASVISGSTILGLVTVFIGGSKKTR